ncbi:Hypothetical protein PENO1_086910 [Penicillium occitanis (nom. inval.)]|nr:Hypothetical protein PENO1_086910 [Penicillium occitanis (nom. inval.)]PCG93015.1 hypothetical protein PENOC_089740 [Penicillium occitanis (nom. inval.)]
MRLSLAIFATYLATIIGALPTTPMAEAGSLSPSKPMDNLIFAYGGGPNPKETREQQQNEKRCDITDLECWQHGGHAVERRESESGPVYGILATLDV